METRIQNQTTQTGTIQAVIFDLDGVLINSEWLAFTAWQDFAAQCGGKLDESTYALMTGISAEETAEAVQRYAGITFDTVESVNWIWRRMTERLKIDIRPMPGAETLVRTLAAQGYPLAIASNSIAAYIDSALDALKLEDCFPVRVGIDQVAQGKPAPDVYLRAAERLGVSPTRCMAIEDSRVGVRAAAAAGMRVIAVPGEHDQHDGFHGAWEICESLVQVEANLENLLI